MKKVLILAYDFPPYVSVGGLRPYAWYKYLKDYGIEPVVITRQWANTYGNHLDYIAPSESEEVLIEQNEEGTIIRTPYKPNLANRLMLRYGNSKYVLVRKAISAFYEVAQWIWMIGPKSGLYFAAKNYLASHQVDAILPTGEPFILFRYAAKLSKRFDIPWYADYRDPWVQGKGQVKIKLLQQWKSYWEKKCLENVSGIITVSTFVQRQIASLVKGKTYHIIPNGYDPKNAEQVAHIPQNENCLSLAFAGTVYDWHPLESVLRVCHELVKQNKIELKLNFYGASASDKIKQLVREKYQHLTTCLNIEARMPNIKLLEKLATNHLFLLFNDYSILGTKIFDYVALKRRVLLCYSNDLAAQELKQQHFFIEEIESESQQLQADLLEETKGGYVVKDEQHLAELLESLYVEFMTHKQIVCNSVGVAKYSRAIQAKKLAEVIETKHQ